MMRYSIILPNDISVKDSKVITEREMTYNIVINKSDKNNMNKN